MNSRYIIERIIDIARNQSNWEGYSRPQIVEIPDNDGTVVTVQISSTYLYHKIPRIEYEVNITYQTGGLDPSRTKKIIYNLYPRKGSTNELLGKIERCIKRLTNKKHILELPVAESTLFVPRV